MCKSLSLLPPIPPLSQSFQRSRAEALFNIRLDPGPDRPAKLLWEIGVPGRQFTGVGNTPALAPVWRKRAEVGLCDPPADQPAARLGVT